MIRFSNYFFKSLLLFLLSAINTSFAYEHSFTPTTTAITSESTIEEIRNELNNMTIPVFDFTLKDGEFPSCGYMSAPEGCNGSSLINNDYVEGRFTVSVGGETVYDSGEYVKKETGVRLKLRGNTSSSESVVKKSYKIKLSKKEDLLFRGDKNLKDKDWVLLGRGSRRLNYPAGTEIGRICGIEWEPEGRHVVVIINDCYMGVFYLVEAVSGGTHRVDIKDSGYIVENDAYWWKPDEIYFKSNHLPYQMGWTFKEPDTDDFHEMSMEHVRWGINTLEHHLYGGKDVSDYLDYQSFANWLLAHDILNTEDGCGSNMFMVKKDFEILSPFSIKFQMGPLWDFDDCFHLHNDQHPPIWEISTFYYPQLLKDPIFQELYADRWREVRDVLREKIADTLKNYVAENPDVYKMRRVDMLRGLIPEEDVTHPASDYNYILKWIDERIPVLNTLILGEESRVENIGDNLSPEDENKGKAFSFKINGLPSSPEEKGVTIVRNSQGKVSKTIK